MNKNECKEQFLNQVAELLGTEHRFRQAKIFPRIDRYTGEITYPMSENTRWRREKGNGRFLDHGLVRYFNATMIQLALTDPPLSGVYTSEASALEALRQKVLDTASAA